MSAASTMVAGVYVWCGGELGGCSLYNNLLFDALLGKPVSEGVSTLAPEAEMRLKRGSF